VSGGEARGDETRRGEKRGEREGKDGWDKLLRHTILDFSSMLSCNSSLEEEVSRRGGR